MQQLTTTVSLPAILIFLGISRADYWSDRDAILAKEALLLPGSNFELSDNEQKVNEILMHLKMKEYDEAFADPSKFLPSIHFFKSKAAIEKSEVYKFIRKVPKGGSLHSHSSGTLSFDAFYNLTYMDGLYGCDDNGTFRLHFFFGDVSNVCDWKLLKNWRNEDDQFDTFLKSKLTLIVDDPFETYEDINVIWNKFNNIFSLISPLFNYRTFLHDYLYQAMQEFHDDNVMYMEIRAGLGKTFDSNGTIYNTSETLQLYSDTQFEFRANNPDFTGFSIIYSKRRKVSNETMQDYLNQYLKIQEEGLGMITGFDLVGQEDLGRPLSDFADELLELSSLTNFYFHAGETNWYGAPSDLNLIDAVLLNTSRIGHAFAIMKHPEICRIVKERNIAIEINPISNQVLKLVDDLRNHVGANLIAEGFPVVITSDDPTFWGAKGVSYDWYMTFMAMTPRSGDLRILKKLAFNSIYYSSLAEEKKPYVAAVLKRKWDDFLREILETYQ